MARYGVSTYGGSTYGSNTNSGYNAYPFTASATPGKYNSATIKWSAITGAYATVTLTRRKSSPPVTVNDGLAVFSGVTGSSVTQFVDNTVGPGEWYYSIWYMTAAGVWYEGGLDNVFIFANRNSALYLSRLLPAATINNLTQSGGAADGDTVVAGITVQSNNLLYNLLSSWGWEFDEQRAKANRLTSLWNPTTSPSDLLPLLAQTMGAEYLPELGIDRIRAMVRDQAYLASSKGTLAGATTYASDIIGSKVTSSIGGNLFLDFNDSSFEQSVGQWTASGATIAYGSTVSTYVAAVPASDPTDFPSRKAGVGFVTLTAATATLFCGSTSSAVTNGIPVSAGTSYTLSGHAKGNATNIKYGLQFFDKFGVTIGSVAYATAAGLTGSYVQQTYTVTSPAGAQYAIPSIVITGTIGNTVTLDSQMLALGGVVTYEDARVIRFIATPTRTNLVPNPSIEAAIASYYEVGTNCTVAQSATTSWVGTKSLAATSLAAGDWGGQNVVATVPVTAGLIYSGSAYTKVATTTRNVAVDLLWYNASNALISTSVGTAIPVTSSAWVRVTNTNVVAPPLATSVKAYVHAASGTAAGEILYSDAWLIEQSLSAGPYFDGNTDTATSADYRWVGTAQQSKSQYYPNRLTRFVRAAALLPNHLHNAATFSLRYST